MKWFIAAIVLSIIFNIYYGWNFFPKSYAEQSSDLLVMGIAIIGLINVTVKAEIKKHELKKHEDTITPNKENDYCTNITTNEKNEQVN